MIVKVCFNVNIGEALKLPLRIDSLNANKNCNFLSCRVLLEEPQYQAL